MTSAMTPTTTSALTCVGLSVGRGSTPVLAAVDFKVEHGERVALLGGNGAGKTTLLRALAGIDPPLTGQVRWHGSPLPGNGQRVRQVGVVFQSEQASRYTVRELVTLGLGLDAPPAESARRLVDDALYEADLIEVAERSCAKLSAGQVQRALLARALVARPRLLLLDEPTCHLDAARQATLLATLDRLHGSVTVVLATHDLALAATCDRVAILHDRGIERYGSTAETLTPQVLSTTLGVVVRRIDDPLGGPPLLRIMAPVARAVTT